MIPLSQTPEQDIRAFIQRWLKLLAANRLDEACALIDEPGRDGHVWTPEQIRTIVHTTFDPQSRFGSYHPEGPIFTDPDELSEQPDCDPSELNDGTGYWLDYDIPLNGERSDLTAQFIFHKRPSGYAVVLQDLHVL